jgi:2-oxo-hept-3-ene-1,7-dioate hydratase
MALSPDEIRIAAERLDQAEKTKLQIRQISLEHPGIYGPYGPVSCYFA